MSAEFFNGSFQWLGDRGPKSGGAGMPSEGRVVVAVMVSYHIRASKGMKAVSASVRTVLSARPRRQGLRSSIPPTEEEAMEPHRHQNAHRRSEARPGRGERNEDRASSWSRISSRFSVVRRSGPASGGAAATKDPSSCERRRALVSTTVPVQVITRYGRRKNVVEMRWIRWGSVGRALPPPCGLALTSDAAAAPGRPRSSSWPPTTSRRPGRDFGIKFNRRPKARARPRGGDEPHRSKCPKYAAEYPGITEGQDVLTLAAPARRASAPSRPSRSCDPCRPGGRGRRWRTLFVLRRDPVPSPGGLRIGLRRESIAGV